MAICIGACGSCAEDSFAGRSGLHCGDFLTVNIVCEMHSMGFKWKRASLSNGVPILDSLLTKCRAVRREPGSTGT